MIAADQEVVPPTGRPWRHCLEVKVTRTVSVAEDREDRTTRITWLAPGVGEARRFIRQDEHEVAESVLTRVAYRKAASP